MKIRTDKSSPLLKDLIIRLATAAIAICVVTLSISASDASRRSENLKIVENGVRRAALECYAAEGFYPDSLDYLVENYEIYTDNEHCIIHYSPVSSNVMPIIKVLPR